MWIFIRGVSALALLVALILALTELVSLLVHWIGHQVFHNVNPTVAAAAVAAMATVTVSALTLAGGRFLERKKAIESEIRAAKIPVYSKLVKGLMSIVQSTDPAEKMDTAAQVFNELTPEMLTWASDEVITEWSRFKRQVSSLPPEEVPFAFEKVLLSIRQDYGHKGSQMLEGDLLGLFINDVDDAIAKRGKRPIGGKSPR